ncbi:SDR family NAD(P)-dependent oxidoreductase [Saccharospirillum impatiens]|uniref:SDR family NAD(P)-dependent oxidoreductase n=1 Tax=Saccharospirillum impatiens TaxID=169438 RepID=UPI0004910443|nr:SDR family oxidoreductase [Saccharospirillum impatiens]
MSNSDSCVIVTGACGGIGKAMTREFKAEGYTVIATDQKAEPVEGVHFDYYISADLEKTVNDDGYAHSIFSQIRSHCEGKPVHALINNAATQVLGGLEDLSVLQWHQTMDVNLIAPIVWTKAFIEDLERDQGSVINVSSIHARLTKKNFLAYATSKAALSGMTRALAIDVGERIRVNAIEPAAIETEMLLAGFKDNPDGYENLKSYHPIARIGRSEEVARLAVFLASKSVGFTHGSCIQVDGAISARLYDPV